MFVEAALYLAAALLVLVGLAHSYLGERYILTRLFRRDNLPRLFGGTRFTTQTLRFAWHLTTLAWFGFAAILVLLARPPVTQEALGVIVGSVFLLHFLVAVVASRARHLSWMVFLAVGLLVLYATHA